MPTEKDKNRIFNSNILQLKVKRLANISRTDIPANPTLRQNIQCSEKRMVESPRTTSLSPKALVCT